MNLSRIEIAKKYLSGSGVEVGALHNPLKVPENITVKYIDRMSKDSLKIHYPELIDLPLVDIDIEDDGEFLKKLDNDSQDFVIANHFLEHCEDPITALMNFYRVLKIGGVAYLAVPNMEETFDKNREETSLDHLVSDFRDGPENSRYGHYKDWVVNVGPHFGRAENEDNYHGRVVELMKMNYSIHFHCWRMRGFELFISSLEGFGIKFLIELIVNRGDEFICILKKYAK